MGIYVDKANNIVEELLKVIPISFFTSEEFQKGCQEKGYSQRWYMCSTSASLSGGNMFASSKEKTEIALENMCKQLYKNSERTLFKFISFIIDSFCTSNKTSLNLKGLKEELFLIGIAKFNDIDKWDNSKSNILTTQSEIPHVLPIVSTKITDSRKMGNNHSVKKQVFIVHGHDDLLKTKVENVLRKLGLKPIVLAQEPNEGDTIIEKFERKGSKADYAIILLTADDKGKPKNDKRYKLRARQNVIFEMGYFRAKLGKRNLCYMYEEEVELPSDIKGIGYVAVKSDDKWQLELVNELQSRGFDVSADSLLK